MARANRHYIPGCVWHITHRCHKREFLLKFAKDRCRYLQWLYQARKRYGLSLLNFNVTSNHVHLLVFDGGDKDVIPHSIQLVAGRTGQEFNQRKNRSGAFWEDRYHATAVETGEHLWRCMVYIDTNMVRAGVVSHPTLWPFSGYNQIQVPRKKSVLIDYERLQELFGLGSYDEVKSCYMKGVENYLAERQTSRQEEWTQSIAVGSRPFVERVKELLGFRAKGREVAGGAHGYQLRESLARYNGLFNSKNDDIVPMNTFFWSITLK